MGEGREGEEERLNLGEGSIRVLHGRPALRLTRIPACELTPRAENLLAQEKLRWLVQGNVRKCPWKFRKSCQPATALPPARSRSGRSGVDDRERGIDCERARNAPTPLLHAPHAFSRLPVSAGLRIPARKRNFLPIQCTPAGTIPSCAPRFARGLARARASHV